jgi:16S rRNA (cytosine967-C5)-methyltransferase
MQNRGRLIALEVRERALDELQRRALRNGASIIQSRLVASGLIAGLAGAADRVLLDVPCSGLGVLRRNADAKWKLTEAELRRLQRRQREILRDYAPMLKPGGKLVYSTCSILPSENEQQVREFLTQHVGEWTLEEELRLRPDREGFDGFYAARLRRS